MKPAVPVELAWHSLIDFSGCDESRLSDADGMRTAMIESVTAAGGTYVTDVFHRFNPWGVSGVVVIAESHLAIHTWPERGYAAVDVFSCSPRLDQGLLIARLHEWLGATTAVVDKRPRGDNGGHPGKDGRVAQG